MPAETPRSISGKLLDLMLRPEYATAEALRALFQGGDIGAAAASGLTGERRTMFADVLKEDAGLPGYIAAPLGFVAGAFNPIDPLNYVPFSKIVGATGRAGKRAAEALHRRIDLASPALGDAIYNVSDRVTGAIRSLFSTKIRNPDVARAARISDIATRQAKHDLKHEFESTVAPLLRKVKPKDYERITSVLELYDTPRKYMLGGVTKDEEELAKAWKKFADKTLDLLKSEGYDFSRGIPISASRAAKLYGGMDIKALGTSAKEALARQADIVAKAGERAATLRSLAKGTRDMKKHAMAYRAIARYKKEARRLNRLRAMATTEELYRLNYVPHITTEAMDDIWATYGVPSIMVKSKAKRAASGGKAGSGFAAASIQNVQQVRSPFTPHGSMRTFFIRNPETGAWITPTIQQANEAALSGDVKIRTGRAVIDVPQGTKIFEDNPYTYTDIYINRMAKAAGGHVFENIMKKFGSKKPVSPEDVLDVKTGLYFHPETLKDMLKAKEGFTNNKYQRKLFRLYQRALSVWRMEKLFLIPSYHIRNVASIIWNNSLASKNFIKDSGAWARAYKDATEFVARLSSGSATESDKRLQRRLISLGVIGGSTFSSDDIDLLARGGATLNPLSTRFIGYKFGGKVAQTIEDWGRVAHWFWGQRKGMSEDRIVDSINKHLFDYSDITEFEKGIRTYAMPFYTWTRKNLPLQLENMINNPMRYVNEARAAIEWKSTYGEKGDEVGLPPWLSGEVSPSLPIPIFVGKDKEGNPYRRYIDLLGFLPTGDVGRFIDEGPLAMLGPVPKAIIEYGTGVSSMSGTPFERYEGERGTLFGMDVPLSRTAVEVMKGQSRMLSLAEKAVGALFPKFAEQRSKLAPDIDIVGDVVLRPLIGSTVNVGDEKVARYIARARESIKHIKGRYIQALRAGRKAEAERLLKRMKEKMKETAEKAKLFAERRAEREKEEAEKKKQHG